MNEKQNINYKILEECRFCRCKDLDVVLDLGKMPLAGAFLKKEDVPNEMFFPLELQYCHNCHLVQVSCVPDPKILFNNHYFFHSSSVSSLIEHFDQYASDTYHKYLNKLKIPKVLEIGCNDGILLRPFSKLGCKVIGVDPSSNATQKILIDDAIIINDFFSEKLSKFLLNQVGKVDLITANFSFAHIDDMHDVMSGINNLLDSDGIFVFEIYYIKTILEEMNYDMIYHEHMSYYSLITLQTFLHTYSMEIFDVKYFPRIRSGALRVYTKYKKNKKLEITNAFLNMYSLEIEAGLNTILPYKNYASKIQKTKKDLLNLIAELKSHDKKIVGYGASGRSTVIMNYCEINHSHLECIVDDAPEKLGYITPGTHFEIIKWDSMIEKYEPDYIILFAWSFIDEVLNKRASFRENGGKFILPLPHVRII